MHVYFTVVLQFKNEAFKWLILLFKKKIWMADSPHRETGNFSSDIKASRGGLIFITERDCVVVFDKAPIILKK